MRPPPKAKEPKQNRTKQRYTPSAVAAYVKQKHSPETTLPSCPEGFTVESTSASTKGPRQRTKKIAKKIAKKQRGMSITHSAVGRISRLTLFERLRQVKHGERE